MKYPRKKQTSREDLDTWVKYLPIRYYYSFIKTHREDKDISRVYEIAKRCEDLILGKSVCLDPLLEERFQAHVAGAFILYEFTKFYQGYDGADTSPESWCVFRTGQRDHRRNLVRILDCDHDDCQEMMKYLQSSRDGNFKSK